MNSRNNPIVVENNQTVNIINNQPPQNNIPITEQRKRNFIDSLDYFISSTFNTSGYDDSLIPDTPFKFDELSLEYLFICCADFSFNVRHNYLIEANTRETEKVRKYFKSFFSYKNENTGRWNRCYTQSGAYKPWLRNHERKEFIDETFNNYWNRIFQKMNNLINEAV
jgi:hypothetical protein